MNRSLRRYEMLLPRWFGDRQVVPEELFGQSLLEIRKQFGAVSSETQIIRGLWEHDGNIHPDELVRVFVDEPDTADNRQFFVEFKDRLKTRFQQLDIWMTTYIIEVV